MAARSFTLFAALALLSCSGAWAVCKADNPKRSIAVLKQQAASGDTGAQCDLGLLYRHGGEGVQQDYVKAAAWFRKAAERSDAGAEYVLGLAYRNGEGVSRDYTQAAAWWQKAAEQSNAGAQYSLGGLYELGEGVPRDYTEAYFWYSKAAEQGDADAQDRLADIFFMGSMGVPQDRAQAAFLYRRAAEQDDAYAQFRLALQLLAGLGVSQNTREAMEWLQKAAEQGNADAQYMLGQVYEDGGPMQTVKDKVIPAVGDAAIPKDMTQAAVWFQKAAEQGNASAQCNLGNLYEDGYGVPQNYSESYFLFSLCAAHDALWAGSRDRVATHLTKTEITHIQEQARKWFEDHPAKPQ